MDLLWLRRAFEGAERVGYLAPSGNINHCLVCVGFFPSVGSALQMAFATQNESFPCTGIIPEAKAYIPLHTPNSVIISEAVFVCIFSGLSSRLVLEIRQYLQQATTDI